MTKIKIFFLLLVLIYSNEAYMSQVHSMPKDMLPSLEEIIQQSDHIVIVKENDKNLKYLEIVFPKNTHHKKKEKTIYREYVDGFKVTEVIKSAVIKKGSDIWLWKSPAYGQETIKAQHELDMLESPFQKIYNNKYKLDDKQIIIFLKNMDDPAIPKTYNNFYHAKEGLEAKQFITTFLKSDKNIMSPGVELLSR